MLNYSVAELRIILDILIDDLCIGKRRRHLYKLYIEDIVLCPICRSKSKETKNICWENHYKGLKSKTAVRCRLGSA